MSQSTFGLLGRITGLFAFVWIAWAIPKDANARMVLHCWPVKAMVFGQWDGVSWGQRCEFYDDGSSGGGGNNPDLGVGGQALRFLIRELTPVVETHLKTGVGELFPACLSGIRTLTPCF